MSDEPSFDPKSTVERLRRAQALRAAPGPLPQAQPAYSTGHTLARLIGLGAAPWIWSVGALAAAGAWLVVSAHDQRLRDEDLLLYTGAEIRDAIASYYARDSHGRHELPRNWRDLVEDRRSGEVYRHLDREPPDPITGHKDWVFERRADQGIVGVRSASRLAPTRGRAYASEFASFASAARYSDWVFKFEPGPAPGPRAEYADAAGSAADAREPSTTRTIARSTERSTRHEALGVYEQRHQRRRGRSRTAVARVLLVSAPPTPHELFPLEPAQPATVRSEGWRPAAAFTGTAMAFPGSSFTGDTFAVASTRQTAAVAPDAGHGAKRDEPAADTSPTSAARGAGSRSAAVYAGAARPSSERERRVPGTGNAAEDPARVAHTGDGTARTAIATQGAPKAAASASFRESESGAGISTPASVRDDSATRSLADAAATRVADKSRAAPEVTVSSDGETIVLAYSGPIGPGSSPSQALHAAQAPDERSTPEEASFFTASLSDASFDRSAAKAVRHGGRDTPFRPAEGGASTVPAVYTEPPPSDASNAAAAPPNPRPVGARCDTQATSDRAVCARMLKLHGADASNACVASAAQRTEQCQAGEALSALAITYD